MEKKESSSKKIALIPDIGHWIFATISRRIQKALSNSFQIDIFNYYDFKSEYDLLCELREYDLIHFFWRGHLLDFLLGTEKSHQKAQGKINYLNLVKKNIGDSALTTGIYDHLLLTESEREKHKIVFNSIEGYCVSSKKLQEIYENIPDYPAPTMLLPDGVDLDHFFPRNFERFENIKNRPLVLGWTGNSLWGYGWKNNDIGAYDHKGFYSIVKPAIEMLKSKGLAIVECFSDRTIECFSDKSNKETGGIPYAKMPEFYSQLDIYLCASFSEGTPAPVLEAMACGVPVISTDVGIVPEVFGNLQSKFILKERSAESLAESILYLYQNREMLLQLSKENLESIRHFDSKICASKYGDFFSKMLLKKSKGIIS